MRRPVLVPGTCAGTAIAHARRTRIGVRGTDVVVDMADEDDELSVTELGGVTRVVLVPPDDTHPGLRPRPAHGLVALMQGTRAGLVLDPRDWVCLPDALHGRDLRVVSGVEALAQAIGLTVEAATPAEAETVRRRGRRAVTRPRPEAPGPVEDLTLVMAIVVGFLAMPMSDTWLGPVLTAVALVPAAAVAARLHARRRRFRRLVTSAPAPDGRRVVRSSLGEEWGGLSRSELQIGADYLVHHARGRETWVPGPALGGARRWVAAADALVLLDAEARPLLSIDARVFDAETVHAAASAAGLDTERTPLPVGYPAPVELTPEHAERPAIGGMTEVDLGSTTWATPALALCASLLLLVAGLLDLRAAPLSWVLVAGAIALLGTVLHAWWLVRQWWSGDRAGRRTAASRREEGAR